MTDVLKGELERLEAELARLDAAMVTLQAAYTEAAERAAPFRAAMAAAERDMDAIKPLRRELTDRIQHLRKAVL